MQLRPYQEQAISAVLRDWETHPAVLGVAATGAGKTQVYLDLLRRLHQTPDHRSLVIAHRKELIDQPIERTQRWAGWNVPIGAVQGDRDEVDRPITIATVQTLSSDRRLHRLLAFGPISTLVIDETHHVTADTYMALIERLRAVNPNLKILGVTATPMRADGDGLSKVFAHVSFKITIADLVKQHYLVQPRWLGISTGISLKGVETRAGDYVASQLASRYDTEEGRAIITQAYLDYAKGRRSIAFTASVAGAYELADAFQRVGVSAVALDGTTPKDERDRVLNRYRAGDIQVLVNCQLLTEGFDAPGTSCVLMCRPTKSDSVYIQCLDTQTEVLTDVGWVSYDTAWMASEVAAFDVHTGEIKWRPIQDRFYRPLADGEQMYALQSPTVDIRVTGGHRLLMRHRRSINHTWRFEPAERLAQKQSEYLIPVAGGQIAPGLPLSLDDMRFLGVWLSDGTINKQNRQVSICQAEHQPQNADIVKILAGCGISYSIQTVNRKSQFNSTSPALYYILHRGRKNALARFDLFFDKSLSPLFEHVTSEQLGALLEGLHIGDGIKERNVSWTRRTYHICTGNLTFAERLQSLCVRRGFRCNMATHCHNRDKPYYVLHVKFEQVRYVGGANQHDRDHLEVSPTQSDEHVWCLSNDLQTLITRRNGKVAIVGNCMGRGLRPAAGVATPGEDCLILDFMPADSRNIVMAGDVLGLPKEITRQALKEKQGDEEPGEVQAGFTFDGETFNTDGTPLEIIARQLDYLQTSPYIWERRDGWLTLGLGEGPDGYERILVITPPESDGQATLWGLARVKGAWEWQRRRLADGTLEELGEQGNEIAARWCAPVLASKGRSWQGQPATDGQLKYLRKLMPKGEKKPGGELTKGHAAALITHYQARMVLDV